MSHRTGGTRLTAAVAQQFPDALRTLLVELRRGRRMQLVGGGAHGARPHEAAVSLLGTEGVVPLGFFNMGGEHFACYMEHMPGCSLRHWRARAGR